MLLYRHAPSVGGIGGWSGFEVAQICARLSGQSESFWEVHTYDCHDMVNSRLRSFMITGQTLLYFLMLFQLCRWMLRTGIRSVCERLRTRNAIKIKETTSCGVLPAVYVGIYDNLEKSTSCGARGIKFVSLSSWKKHKFDSPDIYKNKNKRE